MSRLSIYETRWIDLVFENRNKEYGAYQLRHESVKSSLTALFMGLLFVASIGVITSLSSRFNSEVIPEAATPEWQDEIIHVTDVSIQPKTQKPAVPQTQNQATEAPITNDILRDPIIVKPNEASPDAIATNVEIKNIVSDSSVGTGTIGNSTSSGIESGTGTENTTAVDYGTNIVNTAVLDKMPEFPGGMEQFYKYVGNNFKNPEIDAFSSIKIYVNFVIEKDGSMSDIQVKRDPGYGLGKEAVRVLKSLKTKWTPGIINTKPVRTAYSLPIVIQIN